MQIDDWNQMATKALLADAERAVALTQANTHESDAAPEMVANARKNYIDLQRRSRPLIMSDGDLIAFQHLLDRLRACLRFFGESV
ncbi:MAG TPA: hypothetical protein VMU48_01650 [Terracidiphilus sp.]|nr:hypothetical protein [Terracidiphilus sp.]